MEECSDTGSIAVAILVCDGAHLWRQECGEVRGGRSMLGGDCESSLMGLVGEEMGRLWVLCVHTDSLVERMCGVPLMVGSLVGS